MIKKLQRKFVLIAMSSMLLVIVVLISAVNFANYQQIDQRAQGILELLSSNNGSFPETSGKKNEQAPPKKNTDYFSEETPFETRYFLVWAEENGTISKIDTGHIAAITPADAEEMSEKIFASGKTSGYSGDYKYLKTESDGKTLLIFIDCGSRLQSANSFFWSSCGIASLSFLVVFLLVTVFSRRAIRPVIESIEKQKRFITDAGHEIKTPLAIISANTDVIEMNNGKSEWTDSIRNQTKRLNGLVRNLLELSKMEEEKPDLVFSEFSVSDAVFDTAAAFQTLAETGGKFFEMEIEPSLTYYGDEKSIRQLVSILCDNAVKYCSPKGTIAVSLKKSGKELSLKVSNTCQNPPKGNLDRLFDRFYRTDDSRDRKTGGYGIGLSIAKAIVEAHKGRIVPSLGADGTIQFTVLL